MNASALFPVTGKRYRIARRPTGAILPSAPRPMRRDCHGRLLTALLDRAGQESEVVDSGITGWASATFIGARHRVTLAVRGEQAMERAELLRDALPEAEFAIPGHIVADLTVDQVEQDGDAAILTLCVLTIEAW